MSIRRLFQPSALHGAWRMAAMKSTLGRQQGALRWTHSGGRSYRAVIFDMGGVLMPSPGTVAAEWEVQNRVPSGTIMKALIRDGDSGPWMRFMRGEMTTEAFLEEFGRVCSEIAKASVPVDSFFSLLTSETVAKPFPVMTQAISQIRAGGLQTAILTNNFCLSNGKSFLPLDRKQFDVVVESCLEGVCKPDLRIYQLCLQRLNLQPSEAIFLDDLGPNLKAAASLGIHTIKVDHPETAVKELEALLGFPLCGGIPNTRPVRKAMEIPKDALEKYLKGLLGTHGTGPMEILQFDHGQSNPTYFIRLADRQLVLRKKPPGTLLPSAHAIEREFRIMKALGNAGVPVPTVLDLCEDSSIIGTPFYLMEYCPGIIYKDPSLPGLEPRQRQAIYTAMNQVLCRIHSVDLRATGLDSFGKQGDYIRRQVQTWTKQYRAAETGSSIPAMERLIQWLPQHLPRQQRTTVVHGDFRLDNLMFHPEKAEVLAVLDWELSTLGDPFADVAYSCLAHYLPSSFPMLRGFRDQDVTQLGIPTAEEYFRMYCLHMGLPPIDNWNFYMAFSFFRVAAILQGVYKRSLTGQASSATAKQSGKLTEFMAELAWDFATKEGFRIFKEMPAAKPQVRSYHAWAGSRPPQATPTGVRRYSAVAAASPAQEAKGGLIISPEGLSPPVRKLYDRLLRFMEQNVYPLEPELQRHQASADRWTPSPLIEDLKEKAKAEGLWNLFLPLETDPEKKYGAGLTNVEYAHLCEVMGMSLYASEIFNCSAPDTGNMELLVRYGTEEQKARWLVPLLEGRIRSCFAMTEPQVASSDASNIEASIREEGGSYVINGRKWWISGILDPRCKLCVFMGKTDPQAPRHQQQSMVLVPMDTPGIHVIRPLSVYGLEDAPGGHGEVHFKDVRVPKENIILGPGRGFEIAQGRLGPGRIHHCMRLIGYSERALALMKTRVMSRTAFGKPLVEHGTILADIARSRVDIEQARLLVLKAAHLMDVAGNKAAALEIAMIKMVAPSMAYQVIDRAIQAFGAGGLSSDYPLAQFFAWARALRFADGPDEVHRLTVAKMEMKNPSRLQEPAAPRV
ncbi:acyl-CoA dehydrogenase family member 10 isoform X1 [Peromyscus leucopus]|uniref:acyl-CoA dehydrogenase family member 10 isoform X1 n=1 Tax=Peromyscus leucopus TaxID=10041 RepID=UPI0010A1DB39|nr:acyl-CoA dehydrogenase family member 10 isoform X1 [Peromyscus leucopus]XP_028711467.1 acyl-CoA dehydrogenase family member 10 isoform X1 [Peromyscus leucopus]XP_028711468.1 acyl-CoA dehydrogenase family member 10 isoform X1 [Peromyscus leucopus]XP_028711469.1 acyl-CoA dehydrogenase family member 10 isoform X1 [Peromyscus leucopus]XP_028711470.1 acyl-CoA dehydrogenase family member 10 isoform X1 [Peromyscus leucopus]